MDKKFEINHSITKIKKIAITTSIPSVICLSFRLFQQAKIFLEKLSKCFLKTKSYFYLC